MGDSGALVQAPKVGPLEGERERPRGGYCDASFDAPYLAAMVLH